MPRLSAPVAGMLVGIAMGLADAALIEWKTAPSAPGDRSVAAWLATIWMWASLCGLVGVAVSPERLRRLRWVALVLAGPGLMVLFWERTFASVIGLPEAAGVALAVPALAALAWLLSRVSLTRSRSTGAWLAAALISLGVLTWMAADLDVRDWLAEDGARKATADAPNVALIFLDTTRFDGSLGPGTGAMPSLARFAERSVRFDDAWAPAPWTEPSHYAVFTGVDHWLARDGERNTMMAERFRARGYHTAAVFANARLHGLDAGFEELTISYGSPACSSSIAVRLSQRLDDSAWRLCATMDAGEVTRRARSFLRRAERPWFLALNYKDPHAPYRVPPGCGGSSPRLSWRQMRLVSEARPGLPQPSPALVEKTHRQYRDAIRCMDEAMAPLLDELEREPNTIVAVVGDHGEQFGEHGMGGHGNSVYRQVLHVPLVLRAPGLTPSPVAEPVSITDLHASLLSAAEPRRTGGRMVLLDPSRRRGAVSHFAFTAGTPKAGSTMAFSIAAGGYHLLLWDGKREELFRYADDPAEERPLAAAEAAAIAAPLREALAVEQRRQRGSSEFNALGYLQQR